MYEIFYSKQPRKYLLKIQPRLSMKIYSAMNQISRNDVQAKDITFMAGSVNTYRLRLGQLRIIYEVRNDILVITVIKVGSRGDIYK
jgi:mRNA interferase RelE/StbE